MSDRRTIASLLQRTLPARVAPPFDRSPSLHAVGRELLSRAFPVYVLKDGGYSGGITLGGSVSCSWTYSVYEEGGRKLLVKDKNGSNATRMTPAKSREEGFKYVPGGDPSDANSNRSGLAARKADGTLVLLEVYGEKRVTIDCNDLTFDGSGGVGASVGSNDGTSEPKSQTWLDLLGLQELVDWTDWLDGLWGDWETSPPVTDNDEGVPYNDDVFEEPGTWYPQVDQPPFEGDE